MLALVAAIVYDFAPAVVVLQEYYVAYLIFIPSAFANEA